MLRFVVEILGGFGNQMFQYAFALSLREKRPDAEVFICTAEFKQYKLHNGFELEKVFGPLVIKEADKKARKGMCRPLSKGRYRHRLKIWENTEFSFWPDAYNQKDDRYFGGYWQSLGYVLPNRQLLLDTFVFKDVSEKNLDVASHMAGEESTGVHVRRGDYLNEPGFYGICGIDYYRKAIGKIGCAGKHFYIFSDDIDWCRRELSPLLEDTEVDFVTWNTGTDSWQDMFLMSRCRHLIIANSSFSWWGAFLNRNEGTIIAPAVWVRGVDSSRICPPEWIKIEEDGKNV
ncbi:MAG: alpha-1,2-fucosyltransferase [Bacteroidales bacterium]|nr:alpha-1,2-fucosyltransferase [Bacteroidales bacterium]